MLVIDASLRAFWEVESVPIEWSDDEKRCGELFTTTTTRNSSDGKFIVKLPFSDPLNEICSSLHLAISRLRAMERKFEKDKTFHDLYIKFMKEYEELSHMEEVANN